MQISFFREHIENYGCRTGLSRKTVCLSMGWLWGMLLLSIVMLKSFWISLLLVLIGVAVTIHILRMAKGVKRDKTE